MMQQKRLAQAVAGCSTHTDGAADCAAEGALIVKAMRFAGLCGDDFMHSGENRLGPYPMEGQTYNEVHPFRKSVLGSFCGNFAPCACHSQGPGNNWGLLFTFHGSRSFAAHPPARRSFGPPK